LIKGLDSLGEAWIDWGMMNFN